MAAKLGGNFALADAPVPLIKVDLVGIPTQDQETIRIISNSDVTAWFSRTDPRFLANEARMIKGEVKYFDSTHRGELVYTDQELKAAFKTEKLDSITIIAIADLQGFTSVPGRDPRLAVKSLGGVKLSSGNLSIVVSPDGVRISESR
jgi:hypothetical protein